MQLSREGAESVALAMIVGRKGKQRPTKTELPVACEPTSSRKRLRMYSGLIGFIRVSCPQLRKSFQQATRSAQNVLGTQTPIISINPKL